MRFFVRKRRQTPTVIIVALIDVLIVMLIFLMVTTAFKQQPALNLRPPDVLAWKSQPEFQDVRLGLVYMMNCYGSQFNQTWLELGFKSSIGAKDVNWMPEPMFTLFWTRFRNGEIAIKAAQKAWEDAKNIWKAIYLPLIQLEKTDTPPFFTLAYTENPRIIASTPVVAGNEGFRIIDL